MKLRSPVVACALAFALASTALAGDPPAPVPDPAGAALARARAIEQQLVTTVEAVCCSSVTVYNLQIPEVKPGEKSEVPRSREPRLASGGSGVIITTGTGKTWILTNQHVVDHADKLQVITRDGVTREVKLEDSVEQYDVALLSFCEAPKAFTGVTVVGKRSAELEEGQWCVATGNPFFLATDGIPVVTLGVISGLNRVVGQEHIYGRAIQHDAAVNPGNSGGPLWNLKGELIGINGLISSIGLVDGATPSSVGASYSIPVEEIAAFLAQLVDAKKNACAGFLGVVCETVTEVKSGKPVGARVTELDSHSPAASGARCLQVDDVIEWLSVGDKRHPVRTESELINALALCPAGCRVTVSYRRAGKADSWSGALSSR